MSSRIEKDEQGVYTWTATVDARYEHKAFRIAFGVTGGICGMYLLMSLALGGDMLGFMLLICVAALAVVGGVCWLYNFYAGKRSQRYRMDENGVHVVLRRSNAPFSFRSIRKAVVSPPRNMIELYQAIGSGAVFTAPEDFEFVRDFILQRLPDDTVILYE